MTPLYTYLLVFTIVNPYNINQVYGTDHLVFNNYFSCEQVATTMYSNSGYHIVTRCEKIRDEVK